MLDTIWDKYNKENLTIIQAPRDDYYKSGDDKIIEMINNKAKPKQLIVLIGNRKILKAVKQAGCLIKKAIYFAQIPHSNL